MYSLLKTWFGSSPATRQRQIRNPNSEIRKKPEARNPNRVRGLVSVFGFRISFGLRISDFGFSLISPAALTLRSNRLPLRVWPAALVTIYVLHGLAGDLCAQSGKLQCRVQAETPFGPSRPVYRAYLSLGTNEFAFLVPEGCRVDTDKHPGQARIAHTSRQFDLTFAVVEPHPANAAEPDPEVCRQKALAGRPGAQIIEEFSRGVINRTGPGFDVQFSSDRGLALCQRVLYVLHPAGLLEFSCVSSTQSKEAAWAEFNTFLATFSAKENGKHEISPLSDKL